MFSVVACSVGYSCALCCMGWFESGAWVSGGSLSFLGLLPTCTVVLSGCVMSAACCESLSLSRVAWIEWVEWLGVDGVALGVACGIAMGACSVGLQGVGQQEVGLWCLNRLWLDRMASSVALWWSVGVMSVLWSEVEVGWSMGVLSPLLSVRGACGVSGVVLGVCVWM